MELTSVEIFKQRNVLDMGLQLDSKLKTSEPPKRLS